MTLTGEPRSACCVISMYEWLNEDFSCLNETTFLHIEKFKYQTGLQFCLRYSRFGPVTSVRCLPDKFCAFINFKDKDSSARAMKNLQVSHNFLCILPYNHLAWFISTSIHKLIHRAMAEIYFITFLKEFKKKYNLLGHRMRWSEVINQVSWQSGYGRQWFRQESRLLLGAIAVQRRWGQKELGAAGQCRGRKKVNVWHSKLEIVLSICFLANQSFKIIAHSLFFVFRGVVEQPIVFAFQSNDVDRICSSTEECWVVGCVCLSVEQHA